MCLPAVVLWNFRADRMVSISKALEYADFSAFDRERMPQVCMGVTPLCMGMGMIAQEQCAGSCSMGAIKGTLNPSVVGAHSCQVTSIPS